MYIYIHRATQDDLQKYGLRRVQSVGDSLSILTRNCGTLFKGPYMPLSHMSLGHAKEELTTHQRVTISAGPPTGTLFLVCRHEVTVDGSILFRSKYNPPRVPVNFQMSALFASI
jgi:hypothetical protein